MMDLTTEQRAARQAAINKARAAALESNEAFYAVLTLRDKLQVARDHLASLLTNSSVTAETVERYREQSEQIEVDLMEAEGHARKICGDRLMAHDLSAAQAAEIARDEAEAQAAQHARDAEIDLQRVAQAAAERQEAKERRKAEEAAFLEQIGVA